MKKENEKQTDRLLIHMKLAKEVQDIALPVLAHGGYSKAEIYHKYVAMKVPVCMNTFLKMLKEDVSQYHSLVMEYHQRAYEKYLEHLKMQSRKRIKQDNLEEFNPDK